jgi:RNA polymerase sigma-70 factor (ECF subfamily)
MTPQAAAPADEDLVRSALAGEDEAFTELVRRHKRRVFGMASRFTHDAHQLDDICQEVFIRAYRQLAKFRGESPFEHWLARIAVRGCYDFLRRQRRRRDDVRLDGEHDRPAAPVADDGARELLAFAMGKLGPEERLVITLFELEEKSAREVAVLTGWSESNVKVRAFRAREALKRVLKLHHEP